MDEKIEKVIPSYDVIILGTGPAGLQAAIHAARKKAKVLVLGRPESSSLYKAHIENYCCVPGVKTGEELLLTGMQQAEYFGAELLQEDVITTAVLQDNVYQVTTESGKAYSTYALIISTGVTRRGLGLNGEKDLVGRGVSYCVDCDANFYRNAVVAVVGDGSAAAHGAVTLSKIAREVTLITKDLKVNPALKTELEKSNVIIAVGSKVKEIKGTDKLDAVVLSDGTELSLEGLFIEKGAKGAMQLAAFLGVSLDPEKFTHIITDRKQATNIPGVYAAGDICGRPYQMAKAVGEGCVAGLSASNFALKKKRKETQA
ncbi:MAG: FAD-dependent oxidoreductase [Deltaproteobacteria bacterium]|nr:FAD-dependent oxidoreductase [Deltaproteobacteria bacterium]MBW1718402.1 FAD-dependent oxidoreductase [Deltaproteobacteria bacterium]MBW1931960.1 FAD-dependent oxidoreductase [Deltaproteobacteria bacterium]MBW1937387.1 FAD-dependent oxidoreductase [Deltaproteobacteria bacterium]MBW1964103.1 FAD-dependent oxidoreductase [Deltaproteobacteria bacterium]